MKPLETNKELDYRVPPKTPEDFIHDLKAYKDAIFFLEAALAQIETTANEEGEAFNAIEEALDLVYAEADELEREYVNTFPLSYRAAIKEIEQGVKEKEWAINE